MEIEWGPEIAVDGKRPEWLGDEVDWARTDGFNGRSAKAFLNELTVRAKEWTATEWLSVEYIRLPASHPAYIAIAKGFTPWSGGDEAPGDADLSEPVLFANGKVSTSSAASHSWRKVKSGYDIIGYRRKPETISPQPIGSVEVSGSNGDYYDLSINGATISCNDVIDALGLNFNRGEAFKALWRAGRKPGVSDVYDLDKAVYFTTRERGRLS